jgi:peptidylprolyl isomerase
VSNRAPVSGSNTNARRAAKRATLAEAAAARAKARQRRQVILGALVAVLVIGLSVVLVVVLGGGSKKKNPPVAGPVVASAPSAASAAPAVSLDPALSKKPTVNGSGAKPTKLVVKTLVEGKGPAVKSGQTINVNYVGVSMTTSKEFDSSWSRNQPFSFKIGGGSVIPGWDQGLLGVKVGSRVQLDIPTDLAYGSNPQSADVAGPLRFVVDVLSAQ